MNEQTAIETQLTDSEAHYSTAGPMTGGQWDAIQGMNAAFSELDSVIIQGVPHSEEQGAARDLLKAAHEQVLAALVEHWVEPPADQEVREPDAEADAASDAAETYQ